MAVTPLNDEGLRTKSITFNCFFEAMGFKSDRNPLYASFNFGQTPENTTLYLGDKVFENVSDLDLKRYALRPVTGKIANDSQVFKSAKITFYRQFNGISSKIIADSCVTDSSGLYKAYLTPGTYDVEISYNNQKYSTSKTITAGLTSTFYTITKASVKKHEKDTVCFNNSAYIYICSSLKDNAGRPIPNAEIIIFDKTQIYIYAKTSQLGRYAFSLKPGAYTALIRSEKHHAKRIDFSFSRDSGFSDQLLSTNLFSKSNMICL